MDDDLQVVHQVVAPPSVYISASAHIDALNKYVSRLEKERDEAKDLAKRAEEDSRRLNAMEAERKRKANEYQRNYIARKRAEEKEERRRTEQEQCKEALRSETVTLAQAEQDAAAPIEQEATQEVRAHAVAPGSAPDAPPAQEHAQNHSNPESVNLGHLTQTVLNMSALLLDRPTDLTFDGGHPMVPRLTTVDQTPQLNQTQNITYLFNSSQSSQEPNSIPFNWNGHQRTIKLAQSNEIQKSRIKNFCQSMRKNGKPVTNLKSSL